MAVSEARLARLVGLSLGAVFALILFLQAISS